MIVVNTKDGLRYYLSSVEDFRIVKKHLETQKQQIFTYQIRSELPLRVILKRLPSSADPKEIKLELPNLSFPVRAVKKFTKKVSETITKLPTYIIELENSEKSKEIYDLNRLFYTVVSVESYRPRFGLKQYFRCQRFNHTWPGCALTPRCCYVLKLITKKIVLLNCNQSMIGAKLNVQTVNRWDIRPLHLIVRAIRKPLINFSNLKRSPH